MGDASVVRGVENYLLESRGYEDLEIMPEKQLEEISQNDNEIPNVNLQDADGNTEKNVGNGNNSDTLSIKPISEVRCSVWDVPTDMLTYQKISEKKKQQQNKIPPKPQTNQSTPLCNQLRNGNLPFHRDLE